MNFLSIMCLTFEASKELVLSLEFLCVPEIFVLSLLDKFFLFVFFEHSVNVEFGSLGNGDDCSK